MKEMQDRNFKTINGFLNICIHYFGIRNMCRIKYILGVIRGGRDRLRRINTIKAFLRDEKRRELCLPDAVLKDWERSFIKLVKSSNDELHWKMIEEFNNGELSMIKDFDSVDNNDSPVVLCAERNEISRIAEFLKHYRTLGVSRFLIADNGSTDGTREYLMNQPDVRLYDAKNQYTAQRKSAWQNRMVAEFGSNRWYLYVDADEFIWYPGAEKVSFADYVSNLKKKKICAVKGILLEMYPKGVLGSNSDLKESFVNDYCYFDRDSDYYYYDPDMKCIRGGVLNRIFEEKGVLRTKIPLFYQTTKRFIIGSHHIYPLYEDISSPYGMLIRHYKFLPGDEQKVREALEKKNYADGSKLYKKYVQIYDKEEGVVAFGNGSASWTRDACDGFPIIKDLFNNHK